MKIHTTTLLFLLLTTFSFGQTLDPSIKQILDSVIVKARAISLYSSRVNWDSMSREMYQKAENAKYISDLKPSLEALLNGLADHHGKFINPTNWTAVAYFTNWKQYDAEKKDKREVNDSIRRIVNDTTSRFSYKLLPENIGYLKIVGIAPYYSFQKESEKIRNAVIELSENKLKGWIIDLRYNFGGTMIPMLSGIAPLLGEGIVGGFTNSEKKMVDKWEIRNGNFVMDTPYAVHLPNQPVFKTDPKIAVLISQYTASSGEIVAAALKGKPNTKFFGEATAGYCTATGWIRITDSLFMSISESLDTDRNGTVYADNIEPDVEVKFLIEKDPLHDKGILEAIKWLKRK